MKWLPSPENQSVTRHAAAGLLALLFVAARIIPDMTDLSMWFDEVNMVNNSLTLNMGEFYRIERQVYTSHPPLYFVLIRLWASLAGQSDLALRSMSVLPMLLGAAFAYRVAVDFSRQVFGGVAAAMILGGAGFFKLYAHTTHNYAILLMLVMSLLFFYERWRRVPRPAYAVGIVVSMVLLLYAHYYGVYVVIALNLHALGNLLTSRRDYLRWFRLQVIGGIMYLPWLPVIYRLARGDYDRFGDQSRLLANTLSTDWIAIEDTVAALLFDDLRLYGVLVALGVAALMIRPLGGRRRAFGIVGLLLMLMILSLGFALLVNLRLQSYLPRRTIYLLALFAVLLGYLLAHLPRGLRWAVLVGFLALTWNPPLPQGWAGNWYFRHSVEIAADDARAGDWLLIFFSGELEIEPLRYYAPRLLPSDVPYAIQTDDAAIIADIAYPRERLWVIWSDNAPPVFGGELADKAFTEIDKQRIGWLNVSLYEAAPQARDPFPQTAILPDKVPLPARFGDLIELTDYQLDRLESAPGQDITLWVDWRATQKPDQDYGVFIHVLDAQSGALIGQADAAPSHLGRTLPTTFWVVGQPVYDRYTLSIDPETPPGLYEINMGLYSYTDSLRLPVQGSDGLVIATIEVR